MPKEFVFQVAGPSKKLRVALGKVFLSVRQAIGNFKLLGRINDDLERFCF